MKCNQCGEELIYIGALNIEEISSLQYINNKENIARQYLNYDVVKSMEFNDSECYQYFKAAFEQLTEAEFAKFIFWRDLEKKFDIKRTLCVISEDGKIYGHANCSKN